MICKNQKIWVVVGAWRGLISEVRGFRNEGEADRFARRLGKEYKPIEDEVGVYEVTIPGKPLNSRYKSKR